MTLQRILITKKICRMYSRLTSTTLTIENLSLSTKMTKTDTLTPLENTCWRTKNTQPIIYRTPSPEIISNSLKTPINGILSPSRKTLTILTITIRVTTLITRPLIATLITRMFISSSNLRLTKSQYSSTILQAKLTTSLSSRTVSSSFLLERLLLSVRIIRLSKLLQFSSNQFSSSQFKLKCQLSSLYQIASSL